MMSVFLSVSVSVCLCRLSRLSLLPYLLRQLFFDFLIERLDTFALGLNLRFEQSVFLQQILRRQQVTPALLCVHANVRACVSESVIERKKKSEGVRE